MTENKRSQYLTGKMRKWHNHRHLLLSDYQPQLIASMSAPSVIDQINYRSKNQLKNGVTAVLYDLSIWRIIASRLIIQSLATRTETADLCHHIKSRGLPFLFIVLFFSLQPIIKVSRCFMYVFGYCLSQQKKIREGEQSLVCLSFARDVSMHTVLILHKRLLSQLKYLTYCFFFVCGCQVEVDFVLIIFK